MPTANYKQAQGFGALLILISISAHLNHWSSPEWNMAGNICFEAVNNLLLFRLPTRQQQDQVLSILDVIRHKLIITDSLGKCDHLMVEYSYL